jgi:antitoxin component YwqK of YwqJK toxin-antitoxin module
VYRVKNGKWFYYDNSGKLINEEVWSKGILKVKK